MSFTRHKMLLRLLALGAGLWISLLPALTGPAPAARAQIDNSQPAQAWASIVDCIRPGADRGLPSEASPRLAVTCFGTRLSPGSYNGPYWGWYGNFDSAPSDPALVSFGDAVLPAGGSEGGKVTEATLGQVGSIYGLAYSSGTNPAAPSGARSERLFMGAFTKRMTRFGPAGPGAIYVKNMASGAVSAYVTVPAVVPGPWGAAYGAGDGTSPNFPNGNGASNYWVEMGGVHTDNLDETGANLVGKTGLGDIDIDPQERYLYAVNLNNRAIYRFDTWSSAPQSSIVALPAWPLLSNQYACGAGPQSLRPFGLSVTQDSLYLGFVCSGEGGGALSMGIHRFDLAAWSWAANPAMGALLSDYSAQRGWYEARWRAWANLSALTPDPAPSAGSTYRLYPQPMLTDLALDETGAFILGLRDRFGDQGAPQSNGAWHVMPQGDIMRAAPSGPYSWAAPPTGAESYADNALFGVSDPENAAGGLAYLPGTRAGAPGGEVATTFLDPYGALSFGAAWYDAPGGGVTAREEIYSGFARAHTFAKAAGLGDMEVLCAWAQIGDRIWNDANGNGLQDAGEQGMNGVRVQIFNATDTAFSAPLATVTSGTIGGAAGSYRFYVPAHRAYQIRLEPTQFTRAPLSQYVVSPRNAAGGAGWATDSDLDQISRATTVAGLQREVFADWIDVGLMPKALSTGIIGDRVWSDTNGDGIQNEPSGNGINGAAVTLEACADQNRTASCASWTAVGTTVTSTQPNPIAGATLSGTYLFRDLPPNYYRVRFAPVAGYTPAPRDKGGNDALDSDADPASGWVTPAVAVYSNTTNGTLDMGFGPSATNLSLSLTGPATALINSQFSYTLSYANGSSTANNSQIVHTLPPGLTFVGATGSPSVSGRNITWNLGMLSPGQTGSFQVTVRATALGAQTNSATISTSTVETNYADNTATATTIVQQANLAAGITAPVTVAPGETFDYTLTATNFSHASMPGGTLASAADVSLSNTLPAGLTFISASPPPATTSGAQRTWNLGTLAAGASATITMRVRVATTQPYPTSITNSVSVSTTTPDRTTADDTAAATTLVRYPNLRITAVNAPAQAGEGDPITFVIAYDNNGQEDAANTTLVVTLPSGVTFEGASGTSPAWDAATRRVTWSLGALARNTGGSVTINAQVNLEAPSPLVVLAQISTTTPEPNLIDNQGQAATNVVRPPAPPATTGAMQLAIHSDLDPLSGDGLPVNAVYRSSGAQITWPAGEVLDFTPRMDLVLPAMSADEATFYRYQARVEGWALRSITTSRGTYAADGEDDMGRSGCRPRALPNGSGLPPCGYRYIGGTSVGDTTEPTEADMTQQGHLYFSAALPLQMRSDVYVHRIQGLEAVSVELEVHYTVEVVNRLTGEIVRSETRARTQSYTINLVAPRSAK